LQPINSEIRLEIEYPPSPMPIAKGSVRDSGADRALTIISSRVFRAPVSPSRQQFWESPIRH
jgi:hypothetical protein